MAGTCVRQRRRHWLWAGLVMVCGCQTWYGGMTLPSGRYLQHYPQYFAPDPQFPLPRELATMMMAEERAGGALGGGAAPAPAAPAPAPAVPAPPMPKQ